MDHETRDATKGDIYYGPVSVLVHPPGWQHPPSITLPDDEPGTVLDDTTDRSKWSLLEPPTTAQVIELGDDGQPC